MCGTLEVVTVSEVQVRRRRAEFSLSEDVSGGGRVCVWLLQSLHSFLVFFAFLFLIYFCSNDFRFLVGCRGQAMGVQGH